MGDPQITATLLSTFSAYMCILFPPKLVYSIVTLLFEDFIEFLYESIWDWYFFYDIISL